MTRAYFITHPEVVVDPGCPVPRWHLSDAGIARMRAFAAAPEMQGIRAVWASTETKAIEAAGILAAAHGLPVAVEAALGENDRSATGFLPPDEFERFADAFFAAPETSIRGWERAIDAQARVVTAFTAITDRHTDGDIAVVAHGGVGTLLWCHLSAMAIARSYDQPHQGCWWAYDLAGRRMRHGWRPIAPALQGASAQVTEPSTPSTR